MFNAERDLNLAMCDQCVNFCVIASKQIQFKSTKPVHTPLGYQLNSILTKWSLAGSSISGLTWEVLCRSGQCRLGLCEKLPVEFWTGFIPA
jgi:hypothetical protein